MRELHLYKISGIYVASGEHIPAEYITAVSLLDAIELWRHDQAMYQPNDPCEYAPSEIVLISPLVFVTQKAAEIALDAPWQRKPDADLANN